jgi:hypothetical protein
MFAASSHLKPLVQGYGISDYRDIHPPYRTMADVATVTDAIHKRDMKFVMVLVAYHTSNMVGMYCTIQLNYGIYILLITAMD